MTTRDVVTFWLTYETMMGGKRARYRAQIFRDDELVFTGQQWRYTADIAQRDADVEFRMRRMRYLTVPWSLVAWEP